MAPMYSCLLLLWCCVAGAPAPSLQARHEPDAALGAQHKAVTAEGELLNLKEATEADLKRLGMLDQEQIEAFLAYKALTGPLISVYELQAIPGWDADTIQAVSPWVYLKPDTGYKEPLGAAKQSLTLNHELALEGRQLPDKAPTSGRYKTRLRYLQRQPGQYSLALSGYKVPGPWGTSMYGLEPYSGYVSLPQAGYRPQITAGHYRVSLGQGLMMHQRFFSHKKDQVVYIMQPSMQGVKPYMATNKRQTLQGVGLSWQGQAFTATAYASYRGLDGRVYDDPYPHVTSATKRYTSYKKAFPLEHKNTLYESLLGGALIYGPKDQSFALGVQAVGIDYSLPVLPKPRFYNAAHFEGDRHYNVGTFFHASHRNVLWLGEMAYTLSGPRTQGIQGVGALAGAMWCMDQHVDLAVLGRYYDAHFHAPYGHPWGENKRPRNEYGLYLGGRYHQAQRSYSSYLDLFYHPAPQYRAHESAGGCRWMVQARHEARDAWLFQTKLKGYSKPLNCQDSSVAAPHTAAQRGHVLSFKAKLQRWAPWHLQTQLQLRHCRTQDGQTHYATALAQDLSYEQGAYRVRWRLAPFYAAGPYPADQGFYEQHVAPHATYPSFYEDNIFSKYNYPRLKGRGVRCGVLARYKRPSGLCVALQWIVTITREEEDPLRSWAARQLLRCEVKYQ